MTIKITKFIVKDQINKKTKKPKKKPKWFELELEFEIKNTSKDKWDDKHFFFDRLGEYYPISVMDDPKAYKKEIADINKKEKDFMKALNTPTKQEWRSSYAHGSAIISRKKNSYRFNEFFTYTPVTRAILSELKKIQKDSNHSHKTIPEQYLANLLESLSYFWD